MSREKKRLSTLCWNCRNACGGCSWSRYKVWQPVPGWTAIETEFGGQKKINGKVRRVPIKSYIVLDCPEFIPDQSNDKSNDKEVIKLSRMKWTPELKHDVFRMKEEGLTAPQIAERIGVTPVSVYKLFSNQKARENKEIGGVATEKVQKKSPEPKKEPERDKLLDVLVFRSFDRAVCRAYEDGLPIEEHWRDVVAQIEKLLDGTVKTIRKHPDTEKHYLQIAAVIATDAIPKKEMAPPDGDPSETINN